MTRKDYQKAAAVVRNHVSALRHYNVKQVTRINPRIIKELPVYEVEVSDNGE